MGGQPAALTGPDFSKGVRFTEIPEGGMILGHAAGEPVILSRRGNEIFAVGATCTHYGGPLAEGIVSGDTIRCPWHHACFSMRTGEPASPPALNPIAVWNVRREGELVIVGTKRETASVPVSIDDRRSFVIVGAGAAGLVAAETLRREGFRGHITLVGEDTDLPYDRPNLSKDYLAGNAPEEWIPLRGADHYEALKLSTRPGTSVKQIDLARKRVLCANGEEIAYDALLITTGARPMRLPIPGLDLPHVHYLRSLGDSRAIIEGAKQARRAVVIGSSFIGLEVAAALIARGLEVHVVSRDKLPLDRVLGTEVGKFLKGLHESKGVRFYLEDSPSRVTEKQVELGSGRKLDADLVVVGVGVTPCTELAEEAGLATDKGIVVDKYLQTSSPGVFAAGDVARYPSPVGEGKIRIEHWVLAQRQGRYAALNMMGKQIPFTAPPYFWSNHYDLTLGYTGYGDAEAKPEIRGSLDKRDCAVAYRKGDKILAVATIGRDKLGLLVEEAMERGDFAAVEKLFRQQ